MKRKLIKGMVNTGLMALVLLVGHGIYHAWLADANVVSLLFSAGTEASFTMLALALGYVALRIIVVMLLPGFIAARIVYFCYLYYVERSKTEAVAA